MMNPVTLPFQSFGCGKSQEAPAETAAPSKEQSSDAKADYRLVLVNRHNPIPENWDSRIKTVTVTNLCGRKIKAEAAALQAYLKLKEDLETENILIDLDSAGRSIDEQQKIMDDFTAEYGSDYARNYVAPPGFSEHHTGLAIDVYLIIEGKAVFENSEMMKHPELWNIIHRKLPDYGFILRYPKGKEHITGFAYEPWHLRFVGIGPAREIAEKGITLEGYLGRVNETVPEIAYGNTSVCSPKKRKR